MEERSKTGWLFAPWLTIILLVSGFLGSLILILTPPVTSSSEFSWSAESGEQVGTGLVRPTPQTIIVTGACAEPGSESSRVTADNWEISVDGEGLSFLSPPGGEPVLVSDFSYPCGFELHYSLSSRTVSVAFSDLDGNSALGSMSGVVSEPLQFTRFEVIQSDATTFRNITVETFPWKLERSPLRSFGQLLIFGVVLVFFGRVLWQARLSSIDRAHEKPAKPSVKGAALIHIGLLVGLLGAVTLLPSHFDDGWIFQNAETTTPASQMTDPHLSGALVIQGLWLGRLVSLLAGWGVSFLILKVVFATLVWLAWLLLQSTLRRFGVLRSTGEVLIAASLFGAFAAAFLLTIRPEPVAVVLVSIFFSTTILYISTKIPAYLFLAGLSAVTAVATHPNGFILIGPAIVAVVFAVKHALRNSGGIPTVLSAVTTSVIFGLALVFLEFDLSTALDEASAIASFDGYVRGEWYRWEELSDESSFFWWPIVVTALSALVVFARFTSFSYEQRWILLATASTALGLFLSPSKLATHLGVLVVPSVIIIAFALTALPALRGATALQFAALFGVAGGVTLIALDSSGYRHWPYPWEPLNAGLIEAVVPGSGIGLLWLGVPLVPLLGLSVFRLRNKSRKLVVWGFASLLVLAPTANHLGMLAANAVFHPGWSPAKQRLAEIRGRETCGLLDDVDVIVDAQSKGGASEGGPTSSSGPFGVPSISLTSPGESAVFSVDGPVDDLVMWVKGTERNTDVLVELSNSEGDNRYLNIAELDDEMWQLITIPRASRWETVEVWSLPNARGRSGVLVSGPAEPVRRPSIDELSGKTIFAGPMVNTYIPCAREPGVVEGVWEPSDYLFRNDWGWPIGSQVVVGDFIEVAYREGVQDSFISLVEVVPLS